MVGSMARQSMSDGGAVQCGRSVAVNGGISIDFEQAAVEPGDVVVAVFAAALLHGGEQLFDAADGLVGVAAGVPEQVGEDAVRE